MDIWIYYTVGAVFLAGINGYWLKHVAVKFKHAQHVHLLSVLTTISIAAGLLAFKQPDISQNFTPLLGLGVVGGIAYAISSILALEARRYAPLSLYNGVTRMASFIPIAFFYFVLDEPISGPQALGILAAAFPLLLVGYAVPRDAGESEQRNATWPLIGTVLGMSSLNIINAVAVNRDFGLGVDSFLFIVVINIFAGPTNILTILVKKNRVAVTRDLLRYGVVAGVLNIAKYALFLEALRQGPPSIVLPVYAYHTFISTVLSKTVADRRTVFGVIFLSAWAVAAIILLVKVGTR